MTNGRFICVNRCDIMNLLLLGYLCFCVAINPAKSSDWEEEFAREIPDRFDFYNCTRCEEIEQDTSCFCFEHIDKCTVCCFDGPCCSCVDCGLCWQDHQQLIMMTQIIISILFVLGIIGLFVVYFKICYRTRQHTQRRRRCVMLHEERDLTTQCSTVEDLRERPPPYNEVVRSAPPLYTSPYNRTVSINKKPEKEKKKVQSVKVKKEKGKDTESQSQKKKTSMQEAPPSYPGTPKLQEKIQDSNELPSSPSVVQHI